MIDIRDAFLSIYKGIEPTLTECGFVPYSDKPFAVGDLPVKEKDGAATLYFANEKNALKLEHRGTKLTLFCANKAEKIEHSEFVKMALLLLDLDHCDDRDLHSIANEIADEISDEFGKKSSASKKKVKIPTPVSRSAAKNGDACYDANTFANRLSVVYPELRDEYKKNLEKYGDFMPEEFFKEKGAPVIINVIKENNPAKMKKLFNLLNDIYEDGTNDIQDIIVVTILGQLNNDQELLANCVDYMCEDMLSPVIQVNKYLAKSKRARTLLENPPKYKPKKKKKSMLSTLENQ